MFKWCFSFKKYTKWESANKTPQIPKNIDSYSGKENKIEQSKIALKPLYTFGETWLMHNFSFWSECNLMIQHLVSSERSSNNLQLIFVQRWKIFKSLMQIWSEISIKREENAFVQVWLAEFFFPSNFI